MEKNFYILSLHLIKGIGNAFTKKLIEKFESAENVFLENKKSLINIPGITKEIAESILAKKTFERAQQEIDFATKHSIKILSYKDEDFPYRLKQTNDFPPFIFLKGDANINTKKIISIVGTRKPTEYGKHITKQIIEEILHNDLLIVSGLANGIDSIAHKTSIDNNISTIAVLGHGLDTLYPSDNKNLAKEILKREGGLVTTYFSKSEINASNFVYRNSIIAGLADATLIIEAPEKSGAIITAKYANSYNREVFAIPGRVNDKNSFGCNTLINNNEAVLIRSGKDIIYNLNWDINPKIVKNNNINLSKEEKEILKILQIKGDLSIDALLSETNFLITKLTTMLFNLEIESLIKVMPGNRYTIL